MTNECKNSSNDFSNACFLNPAPFIILIPVSHSKAHKGIGKAYQDVLTKTAVVIRKNKLDECVTIVGKILNDWFLEPLPSRFAEILRSRRSVNGTDDNYQQTHHHIIFKQSDPTDEEVHKGMSKCFSYLFRGFAQA